MTRNLLKVSLLNNQTRKTDTNTNNFNEKEIEKDIIVSNDIKESKVESKSNDNEEDCSLTNKTPNSNNSKIHIKKKGTTEKLKSKLSEIITKTNTFKAKLSFDYYHLQVKSRTIVRVQLNDE